MKVKYMGSADVRLIEAGEDFGGRLAEPVSETVRWSQRDNGFVVDTEEVGLSAEAVELLLEEGQGFLDVSGLEVIPPNVNQKTWLGFKDADEEPVELPVAEVTANPAPRGGRISEPENQEVAGR